MSGVIRSECEGLNAQDSKVPLQSKPVNVNYPVALIRTIAILMVILVHASFFPYKIPGEINSAVIINWFTADVYGAIGYLGVPLFVMLSGALLLNPAKVDEPMGEFFKKRFHRIGLPLIFWTVIYFVWSFTVYDKPVTLSSIGQGLISGSYPILWFLYLLVGLYAVTPILRILVKHIDRNKFTLLIAIWFVGTISVPIIRTFTSLSFDPFMFVITDWVGFFLLGIYLVNTKIHSAVAYVGLAFGLLVAIFGEWFLTASMGEQATGYFHGYLSFNMIIASAALFIILISIPKSRIENGNATVNRLIRWIEQNTLPLYLVHVIVLETLHLGLLGFRFPYTNNLLIDVPLIALVTFVLSAVIIYPLKKIPYVAKLIG
jgi:surface polysaccharide O-acyltransferase-like enzyme